MFTTVLAFETSKRFESNFEVRDVLMKKVDESDERMKRRTESREWPVVD